jgi:hypothetical protein
MYKRGNGIFEHKQRKYCQQRTIVNIRVRSNGSLGAWGAWGGFVVIVY